ncbi:hypothetical protein C4J81_13270 [Deltaproteobacteria bacterium Smac51]|nr:hypothetical protein C4J81_13270 [Deltaproteobacteria bacterium Smac51]
MKKVIFYLLSIFVLLLVKTYAAAEERIPDSSKCMALEPSIYLSADDLEFKIPAAFSEDVSYFTYFKFLNGKSLSMVEKPHPDGEDRQNYLRELYDRQKKFYFGPSCKLCLESDFTKRFDRNVYVIAGHNPFPGKNGDGTAEKDFMALQSYVDFGVGHIEFWTKIRCKEPHEGTEMLYDDHCLQKITEVFASWLESFLSAYEWVGDRRAKDNSKYHTRYGQIDREGLTNWPTYNIDIHPNNCGALSYLSIDSQRWRRGFREWDESILDGDIENIYLRSTMLPPIIIVYSRMINGRVGIETIQFNRQDFALLLIWTEIPNDDSVRNAYLGIRLYAGLPMEVANKTFAPATSLKLWRSILNAHTF